MDTIFPIYGCGLLTPGDRTAPGLSSMRPCHHPGSETLKPASLQIFARGRRATTSFPRVTIGGQQLPVRVNAAFSCDRSLYRRPGRHRRRRMNNWPEISRPLKH